MEKKSEWLAINCNDIMKCIDEISKCIEEIAETIKARGTEIIKDSTTITITKEKVKMWGKNELKVVVRFTWEEEDGDYA